MTESLCFINSRSGPQATTSPAVDSRARPEVNDIIGPAHGFLVVLHHQQRIAARLEQGQRGQQLLVVGGVQADGRLIQDVKHAAEIGAKLGGQPDALGFAARKGGRAAAQLQIAQAHLAQKLQPPGNFRQNVARDFRRAPAANATPPNQPSAVSTVALEKSTMVGAAGRPGAAGPPAGCSPGARRAPGR